MGNKVFIRSMATRGNQGGLPRCVRDIVKLLSAFGKDIILVETVGIGQTEVGITEVADTIVLVLSPDAGDSIQFMKAGIMEIADVLVVNKADLGNAESLVAELKSILSFSSNNERHPVVLATQAISNVGVEELYKELENRQRAIRAAD